MMSVSSSALAGAYDNERPIMFKRVAISGDGFPGSSGSHRRESERDQYWREAENSPSSSSDRRRTLRLWCWRQRRRQESRCHRYVRHLSLTTTTTTRYQNDPPLRLRSPRDVSKHTTCRVVEVIAWCPREQHTMRAAAVATSTSSIAATAATVRQQQRRQHGNVVVFVVVH